MHSIKRRLFNWLGRERYLYLVSRLFFLAYRLGALHRDPEYEWHYFVRNLIRPGNWVLDIGANLGYYSVLFSDLTGPHGKVVSVEPVPLYRRVLKRNLGQRANVVILPYALGERAGQVRMGIPGGQPHRHGLTRILEEGEGTGVPEQFDVEIRPPQEVFGALERLDYIKCDVEGYERHVLPLMQVYIDRHRPLVQVELAPENRALIFQLFEHADYRAFYVRNQQLEALPNAGAPARGDTLFIPAERTASLAALISGAPQSR